MAAIVRQYTVKPGPSGKTFTVVSPNGFIVKRFAGKNAEAHAWDYAAHKDAEELGRDRRPSASYEEAMRRLA